jgi:hypothetical protein
MAAAYLHGPHRRLHRMAQIVDQGVADLFTERQG